MGGARNQMFTANTSSVIAQMDRGKNQLRITDARGHSKGFWVGPKCFLMVIHYTQPDRRDQILDTRVTC